MQLDVAIIGGGLAGSALARQLQRAVPELNVAVFERNDGVDYKVGESTVEIASAYLGRRLGLSRYLYENHLPKNGLRFFFDDPTRSTALEDMSEIGSDGLPFHPSFQLDRARIDADLRAMNVRAGVTVRQPCRVRDLQLGTGGAPHRFTAETDDRQEAVTTRWLVDASGRARLLAKARQRSRIDHGHDLCAAWGRFTGVADMDDHGPASWRDRVRGTSRYLSTNHFCYPGYWIWFIPIGRGVVSVGVVCEREHFDDKMRRPEGLLAFVRRHRAPAELLQRAEPIDAMGYSNVSYATDTFFSPDRWATVGEAGAFTDPFYSPGSDFIAMENDMTTDLIARDFRGESDDALRERVSVYDEFMGMRLQSNIALYRNLYPVLGSYDLLKLKWDFDIHFYYNLWLDAYLRDRHLDLPWLREQLKTKHHVITCVENFGQLFRDVAAALWSRNAYHQHNLGRFYAALEPMKFIEEIGRERSRKEVFRQAGECCNRVLREAVGLLEGEEAAARREPLPFYEFMLDRRLASS